MKRILVSIAVVAALLVAIPALTAGADDGPVFVQASSTFDQFDGGTVQFDSVDGANGVTTDGESFTVGEAGLYLIIAAPQVGGIKGDGDKGSANFWIAVNGDDVANSNVTWQTAQKSDGDVIVSQGVSYLQAGDEVSVEWSTTGPAIEAITTPGEPLTPSIIFTLVQVG